MALRISLTTPQCVTLVLAVLTCLQLAWASEAIIRKNLAERLPNLPRIDEVTKTAMPGVWEVRVGNELLYTDEQANFIIEGEIIDARTRTNLTQARIDKLTAFDFAKLPLKDAIVIKQGSGARKMAVFVDPNCGYCRRFERDLAALKDVTIYTFLYPILGADSAAKARDVWCAKDPAKAWRDLMLQGTAPPSATNKCDASAIERNTALGQKHRVQGTPAAVFEDGSRIPGAVATDRLEKALAQAGKKS